VVFAHRSRKLVGCILTDVGNALLYTLELGTLALSRIGVSLAPAEGSLCFTLLGFELLELLKRELQDGSIGGYSWVLESYVDTDDGLRRFLRCVWTVESDCHVPMGTNETHCVACDFALEARSFAKLHVVYDRQPETVAFDTAGIVSKLEGDSLGPLVLLRVLCFAPDEVIKGCSEVAQ
jgi:hypothetical protein